MGLSKDIATAFVKSMGGKDMLSESQQEHIETLSKDLSQAFVDFLTKQTFTITELKAVVEVEEIKTMGPTSGDVLPTVAVTTSGGPGTVTSGKNGVLIPRMNFKKTGGQGGSLKATGHAYVGNPARKVPNSDTIERENQFTKVQLLKSNVRDE